MSFILNVRKVLGLGPTVIQYDSECDELDKAYERMDELEGAIAYAHGRLCKEDPCPTSEDMAESLRELADERAGWIEVAIDHNKQCKQLNPKLRLDMPINGPLYDD